MQRQEKTENIQALGERLLNAKRELDDALEQVTTLFPSASKKQKELLLTFHNIITKQFSIEKISDYYPRIQDTLNEVVKHGNNDEVNNQIVKIFKQIQVYFTELKNLIPVKKNRLDLPVYQSINQNVKTKIAPGLAYAQAKFAEVKNKIDPPKVPPQSVNTEELFTQFLKVNDVDTSRINPIEFLPLEAATLVQNAITEREANVLNEYDAAIILNQMQNGSATAEPNRGLNLPEQNRGQTEEENYRNLQEQEEAQFQLALQLSLQASNQDDSEDEELKTAKELSLLDQPYAEKPKPQKDSDEEEFRKKSKRDKKKTTSKKAETNPNQKLIDDLDRFITRIETNDVESKPRGPIAQWFHNLFAKISKRFSRETEKSTEIDFEAGFTIKLYRKMNRQANYHLACEYRDELKRPLSENNPFEEANERRKKIMKKKGISIHKLFNHGIKSKQLNEIIEEGKRTYRSR